MQDTVMLLTLMICAASCSPQTILAHTIDGDQTDIGSLVCHKNTPEATATHPTEYYPSENDIPTIVPPTIQKTTDPAQDEIPEAIPEISTFQKVKNVVESILKFIIHPKFDRMVHVPNEESLTEAELGENVLTVGTIPNPVQYEYEELEPEVEPEDNVPSVPTTTEQTDLKDHTESDSMIQEQTEGKIHEKIDKISDTTQYLTMCQGCCPLPSIQMEKGVTVSAQTDTTTQEVLTETAVEPGNPTIETEFEPATGETEVRISYPTEESLQIEPESDVEETIEIRDPKTTTLQTYTDNATGNFIDSISPTMQTPGIQIQTQAEFLENRCPNYYVMCCFSPMKTWWRILELGNTRTQMETEEVIPGLKDRYVKTEADTTTQKPSAEITTEPAAHQLESEVTTLGPKEAEEPTTLEGEDLMQFSPEPETDVNTKTLYLKCEGSNNYRLYNFGVIPGNDKKLKLNCDCFTLNDTSNDDKDGMFEYVLGISCMNLCKILC